MIAKIVVSSPELLLSPQRKGLRRLSPLARILANELSIQLCTIIPRVPIEKLQASGGQNPFSAFPK